MVTMPVDVFAELESNVRSYCRAWPAVWSRARGARLEDEDGREYLDFFSGAGALNYGHNPPPLKRALISYLEEDGVLHALDMSTRAKREFLLRFDELILRPRGMSYKLQFTGPTGANAVEAALKLARKATGRETVIAFSNAFHGMTLGALAVSANPNKRRSAGVPLNHAATVPYEGRIGEGDSLAVLESMLSPGGGLNRAAAVIVETVQGEGGLHAASTGWLRGLEAICRAHDMLLIADDVQAGCGRTGTFFSFEPAGIEPDIICLSKSISGIGQPMALALVRPDLDLWAPGEHNGTFRGNNAAFVTAAAALREWWADDALSREVARKSAIVEEALGGIIAGEERLRGSIRGRGLLIGLHSPVEGMAERIAAGAYERGLLVETSGAESDVVKLMPPLTIEDGELAEGLRILGEAASAAAAG